MRLNNQPIRINSFLIVLVFILGLFGTIIFAESESDVPTETTLSSDTKLTMITVNGVPLDNFDPENTVYHHILNSPADSEHVTIGAETSHPNATVSGDGSLPVTPGPNLFILTVLAEDCVTSQNHEININLAIEPENSQPDSDPEESDSIDQTSEIDQPLQLSIHSSSQWEYTLYNYYETGVNISSYAGISAVATGISDDYTVEATVNDTAIPADMTYREAMDNGTLSIDCRYYGDTSRKGYNVGDNVEQVVTFPTMNMQITVTDNQTGESQSVSYLIEEMTPPSAYDAYHNHRYDEKCMFESRFLNYMQDVRIDQNAEDIQENREDIEENREDIEENKEKIEEIEKTVEDLQLAVHELTCRVDELDSQVDGMRRFLFSFAEAFDEHADLHTIDFWYREQERKNLLAMSLVPISMTAVSDNDWIQITIDRDQPEIDIEWQDQSTYELLWIANYADGTSKRTSYLLSPESEQIFEETDIQSTPDQLTPTPIPSPAETTRSSETEATTDKTESSRSTDSTSTDESIAVDQTSQKGLSNGLLILIIAVTLVVGAAVGILGFLIGSGKVKLSKKDSKSLQATQEETNEQRTEEET